MTRHQFEHDGHECVMHYDGESLPAFMIDGVVLPPGVIREDDINHVGNSESWWEQEVRLYVEENL